MADIYHDFPIRAPQAQVFEAISSAQGLDAWWTKQAHGEVASGAIYDLGFGQGYAWQAKISNCVPGSEIEWEMTRADADWLGTRVGFRLQEKGNATKVHFHHTGWPEENVHYRTSSFCWAMYLRLLKRYVEQGDVVAYDARLEA